MIVPNVNFRPDPRRAIFVQGTIDQQLIDRLTPRILLLQSQNRNPITVYIDSRGGSVANVEVLLRLLSASDQDSATPCRLITVVTSRAASAAADLLSSGNYAIAFPESTILYHGVSNTLDVPLTVEIASFLTENLKLTNDRYAMALARKSEWRFMFRFVTMRSAFEEFRKENQPKTMTDLDCFLGLVSKMISEKARKVLAQAKKRHGRYNALLDHVLKVTAKSRRAKNSKRIAEFERVIIKGIVDFEVSSNKGKEWTFRNEGLTRLSNDFFLLQEYLTSSESEEFKQLCLRWADFVLTTKDQEQLKQIPEQSRTEKKLETVLPQFKPLWSFFVALCHALQEGENELTARDAFWLGLIDEVIGATDTLPLRHLSEFTPDPEAEVSKAEEAVSPPEQSAPDQAIQDQPTQR